MAPSLTGWLGISAVASVAIGYTSPQYLISNSRVITALAIYTVVFVGYVLYWAILYPRYFTPFKSLPSASIIGEIKGRSAIEKFIFDFVRNAPANNGILRTYMPHAREMLVVISGDALADILTRKPYDFVKPDNIKFDLSSLFARGLFIAEGDEHKRLRKNLAPAFSFRHIKSLYPVFWNKSLQMAAAMERELKGNPTGDDVIIMHDWTTRTTMDIVGQAGMGYDFGAINDPENNMYQTYHKMSAQSRAPLAPLAFARNMGLEALFRVGLLLPTKRRDEYTEAMETVRGVARQMIEKHRKEEKHDEENPARNIIAVAMRSGTFTNEGLVDEAMTFIGAGHETTSVSFLWGVYMLCKHPEIQKRLREEIRSTVAIDSDLEQQQANAIDEVTPEMVQSAELLENLPYLNAFCNELLRFYPAVPITLRRSLRATTVAGIHVPADTAIAMPIRAINRDPALWGPDANEFNPDRWTRPGMAGSGGASTNYANMTFLHGPRSCIGLNFARGELIFLIAAMVGRFEMRLEEDTDKEIETELLITIVPKHKMFVKLTPVAKA